jgi:hypothetical protein
VIDAAGLPFPAQKYEALFQLFKQYYFEFSW